MVRKLSLLEWLTEYIEAVRKADTACEQKLVLSNLREVRDLLGKHVGSTEPICEKLLIDARFELSKSSNEDATHLVDKIDDILQPKPVQPEIPGEIQVSDFVPELIEKLIDQLKLDHNRWGNTWLNRPKEGQELRTKARYTDYFDMFEQAGTPVPWLKIIGGALICWIRERHPELCLDSVEIASETPVSADQVEEKCGLLVRKETKDAVIEGDVCPISGEPTCGHCRSWIVTDCTKEDEYWRKEHKFDCAVHNEPALPKSECDCYECNLPDIDGEDVPVEDATIKELIESKPIAELTAKELIEAKPDKTFAELCTIPLGKLTAEESSRLSEGISQSIKDKKTAIAHVHNEKITNLNCGTFEITERIVLESVKFVCHSESHPDYFLATCSVDGLLLPASRQVGILGTVFVDGQYQLRGINGVGAKDVILVNYDYEYDLPLDTE